MLLLGTNVVRGLSGAGTQVATGAVRGVGAEAGAGTRQGQGRDRGVGVIPADLAAAAFEECIVRTEM